MKFDEVHEDAQPPEIPEISLTAVAPDLITAESTDIALSEQEQVIVKALRSITHADAGKLSVIDRALLEATTVLFESLARSCKELTKAGNTSSRRIKTPKKKTAARKKRSK